MLLGASQRLPRGWQLADGCCSFAAGGMLLSFLPEKEEEDDEDVEVEDEDEEEEEAMSEDDE